MSSHTCPSETAPGVQPPRAAVRHGFFANSRGQRLFHALHPGDARAWVFCNPFLEEKNDTHSVYVTFARALTRLGPTVLRFDYAGDGDSDARTESVGLPDWVDDVVDAVSFVRRECGAVQVGLFGLRLGGTIAAMAASGAGAEALLLWQPVVDGGAYLQECLRFNLATQLATGKKVEQDRAALLARLHAGEAVNIRGYEIGARMALPIGTLDLHQILSDVPCPTCVMTIGRGIAPQRARALDGLSTPGGLDVRAVDTNAFWQDARWYDPAQRDLVAASLAATMGFMGQQEKIA